MTFFFFFQWLTRLFILDVSTCFFFVPIGYVTSVCLSTVSITIPLFNIHVPSLSSIIMDTIPLLYIVLCFYTKKKKKCARVLRKKQVFFYYSCVSSWTSLTSYKIARLEIDSNSNHTNMSFFFPSPHSYTTAPRRVDKYKPRRTRRPDPPDASHLPPT